MCFGQAHLRRIDCLVWTECGDSSCNWLTYCLIFVRCQSNWCRPAVPNGITGLTVKAQSCLLSDPGTMAKGNPVGQSTAAVSSTHAAKLTGYNQAGKTGPTTAAGLEALWWPLPTLAYCWSGYFCSSIMGWLIHLAKAYYCSDWYTLHNHDIAQAGYACGCLDRACHARNAMPLLPARNATVLLEMQRHYCLLASKQRHHCTWHQFPGLTVGKVK